MNNVWDKFKKIDEISQRINPRAEIEQIDLAIMQYDMHKHVLKPIKVNKKYEN